MIDYNQISYGWQLFRKQFDDGYVAIKLWHALPAIKRQEWMDRLYVDHPALLVRRRGREWDAGARVKNKIKKKQKIAIELIKNAIDNDIELHNDVIVGLNRMLENA